MSVPKSPWPSGSFTDPSVPSEIQNLNTIGLGRPRKLLLKRVSGPRIPLFGNRADQQILGSSAVGTYQESDPLSHLPAHRPAPLSFGLGTNHPVCFPVCAFAGAAVRKHHKPVASRLWRREVWDSGVSPAPSENSRAGAFFANVAVRQPRCGLWPGSGIPVSASTVTWPSCFGHPCLHIVLSLCVCGHISFLA